MTRPEDIPCRHSWHYGSDGLPLCRGEACDGYTVACGQGMIPCERHAHNMIIRAGARTHTATLRELPQDPHVVTAVCQCGITALASATRIGTTLRYKHRDIAHLY